MTNVGQRGVQGSVAQGIRDAWDKFGEPSGRHVEVLMWMVLYVCLKKLALSVNCYYWAHYLPYTLSSWPEAFEGAQVDGRLESYEFPENVNIKTSISPNKLVTAWLAHLSSLY